MIKVQFISTEKTVSKVVRSEKEAYRFGCDMAAKYGFLFTRKPYIISRQYL
jgi:hypothetical protein